MEKKMVDLTYEKVVTLWNTDEFLNKYPRFKGILDGEGKQLFDEIMKPEIFINASVLADKGYPSVLAVAEQSKTIIAAYEALGSANLCKQFIGSVICVLMEANGYKKTGKKKSVPHESFSTGECYVLDQEISRLQSVQLCGSERLATLTPVETSVRMS
jgi:hypothetical protein